jgi:hypothetical protein
LTLTRLPTRITCGNKALICSKWHFISYFLQLIPHLVCLSGQLLHMELRLRTSWKEITFRDSLMRSMLQIFNYHKSM